MADAMKLLPCPMCGADGHPEIHGDISSIGRRVSCEVCGTCGPNKKSSKDAIAAWNRRASPPAREEAPAEGAGELIADLEALLAAEPVFVVNHPIQRAINALRNRTSEPEAGAVAWLHTLHLELEQTFSRLTENPQHPFGKPGEDYSEEYRVSTTPLFTRPAPATADKLKVAVEALEPFAAIAGRYLTGGLRSDLEARAPDLIKHFHAPDFYRARQALAALNEQPQ